MNEPIIITSNDFAAMDLVMDFVKTLSSKHDDRDIYIKRHNTATTDENECDTCDDLNCEYNPKHKLNLLDFITRIIAQDDRVVIFWADGEKTVVKCSKDEPFDYEKGIAMAILKYTFGNKYYESIQTLINTFPHTTSTKVAKKTAKKSTSTKNTTKTTTKSTSKSTSKSTTKTSVKATTTPKNTIKK